MRLLELEVRNVRGIRDLHLKPEGKNMVIWGPNGSGKSGVVDAIDFLLTGRMSRLGGRGTAGISLAQHGPHVDSEAEKAIVRGVLQIPGLPAPVPVARCLARPGVLEYEKTHHARIEPLLALAKQGQHVLTRREILRYVTAESRERAEQIQQLLNIADIEAVRRSVVTAENQREEEVGRTRSLVENTAARVAAITGVSRFDHGQVAAFVNAQRGSFRGEPLDDATAATLKEGLVPPAHQLGRTSVNVTLAASAMENLQAMLSLASRQDRATREEELRQILDRLRRDPALNRALTRRQLTELGLGLLDEGGACPLCEAGWPPDELKTRLEERLREAGEADAVARKATEVASRLREPLVGSVAHLRTLFQAAGAAESDIAEALRVWMERLDRVALDLQDALTRYPSEATHAATVAALGAPNDAEELLKRLKSDIDTNVPRPTPEQEAWDALTRLQEALKAMEDAHTQLHRAQLVHRRAQVLHVEFREARDSVLDSLYDRIESRFIGLYQQLHGIDEGRFTAKIRPDGAGLDFKVDFYGRGHHPPQALHSEGHQDSMGICLYLSLSEYLTGGQIDLVILDDVMMSVDAEHRRELCRLLATAFPNRQLLITTHDRTWAHQLRAEGVVESDELIQFYGWSIEAGPRVLFEWDLWERIEEEMQRADVSAAAGRLRRGAEEYFARVCDALAAPVRYRLNARWDLGDFLPAAMVRCRRLLKKAKQAAQSWGQAEEFDRLTELESTAAQVFARTQAEQWAINANVHYNNWANFSEPDFREVVEAFQDLFDLFRCESCQSLLELTWRGPTPATCGCNCGHVSWNLRTPTDPERG